MRKTPVIIMATGIVAIGIAFLVYLGGMKAPAMAEYISPHDLQQVARGKAVYASHCAACHGSSLEGQPNWRQRMPNGRLPAPPHDQSGHTWHHPDAVLFDITKNGLVPGKTAPEDYVSDMPAFGHVLSDDDIRAVLAYIKSTWPKEIADMQKSVTMQQHERQTH